MFAGFFVCKNKTKIGIVWKIINHAPVNRKSEYISIGYLLVDADPQGNLTTSLGWTDQDHLPVTLATQMEKIIRDEPIETSKAVIRILSGKLARGYTNEGETSEVLQKLKIVSKEETGRIDEILEQRMKIDEEKRQIALRTKGQAMLSGNIYCAHCGGRITTTHHKDHYFWRDGSEYLKDELKYRCYHKANKLCECEGQTNYIAAKVDETVCRIMRQVFENMDGAPEEEKYRAILKKQQAAHAASKRKITLELNKNQKQLEVLQMEIGKTLLGDSLYSPEDLKEAINVIKERIADGEEKLKKLESEMLEKKEMVEAVLPAYRRFKTWAEEFDSADLEQKKMIACQLFDRIELGKDYQLTVYMNVTYKQFCSEWAKGYVEMTA